MKKAVFFIMSVLTFFALFAEVSVLQIAPMFMYLFLEYLNIWNKKSNDLAIFTIAAIMLLINVFTDAPSLIDSVLWISVMIVHFKDVK